jgi:acetyltransferase
MSIRNLEHFFHPKSIAVIGASNRPRSVGAVLMQNLLEGEFAGPIMPVNLHEEAIAGVMAYASVEALPKAPDLALICTPAATVPGLIAELGARGTRAVVVLSAGLNREKDETGRSLQDAALQAARPYLLRILGPNCVGLILPLLGLNASFAHSAALPGKIAFLSQSGALTTSVLDWAKSRGIGFSSFVSLGNSADVDFGDLLDYLGSDPDTRAILLYIESVTSARKFMSAARAAARNKPVIALKAGRHAEGAQAAASHTGALAGSDIVYDAAIRRAGMLRVYSIEALFDAVETLGRVRPVAGDRLAILTNGGGPGVMATDALVEAGGCLASLSEETRAGLDEVLPGTWSRGNPVDIVGDAPVERYRDAFEILAKDPGNDALLFIHSPTAIVPALEIAEALAPLFREMKRPVFSCWLGGDGLRPARQVFFDAGLATFDTPEDAVYAFAQTVDYRRNQESLMATPAAITRDFEPDRAGAETIVEQALEEGRRLLNENESKALLAAYRIPVASARIAGNSEEASHLADEIGFPVALKILSPDITHKSDVGGVALDLDSAEAVLQAAQAMTRRVQTMAANATLSGFTVQEMVHRPQAQELILGASVDPIFGPIILFGHGGTAVEVLADRAIALPPLNTALAESLIARTRVARLLAGYRDRPPADLEKIAKTLVKLSQLISDLPQIVELDINPLLADDQGVLALDARVLLKPYAGAADKRLAIHPYPHELETEVLFEERPLTLRPIRPEDEPAHAGLFQHLESGDIRFRFFGSLRQPVHSQLARFTQIDYDREMAFIATRQNAGDRAETLGVARLIADPDNYRAEFAIVVRSALKGKGLGSILFDRLITYARAKGLSELVGQVLQDNQRMLALAEKFGFRQSRIDYENGIVEVCLDLAKRSINDGQGAPITQT